MSQIRNQIENEITPRSDAAAQVCVNFNDLLKFTQLLEKELRHLERVAAQRQESSTLDGYVARCHAANIKWWQDPTTGESIQRNRGELLALIHSEISEALEGERKILMDDKLPQYPMPVVELVDAFIRICDYLGGIWPEYNMEAVFQAKMKYNAQRADHSHAHRLAAGGKKF